MGIESALQGTGIEPRALVDPDNLIPYSKAGLVLDRCANMTRCSNFGLLLGSWSDYRDLGLPGQLMANAPNLEVALSSLVSVQQMNSRGASVYLHRSGENWVFGYGIYAPDAVARQQIYPLIVAMMANSVRILTNGVVRPIECMLPTRQPNDADHFMALIGAPVRFNQPEAGILLPPSALDTPIPAASSAALERLPRAACR